jgi:hypothetical protein
MNACAERQRVQDYLDRALEPAAAGAFRSHLATCAECAAELALYRRVFDALAAVPTWDPGPALTERVLGSVLPSQVRRHRRLVALGWGYAGTLAAMLAAVGVWSSRPGAGHALEALSGEASRRVLQTGVFMLNSFTQASLRFAEGWGVLATAIERLSPVNRAVSAMLAQPAVALTSWAAALVCVGVLWWMRPRSHPAARGVRHVSVLGF